MNKNPSATDLILFGRMASPGQEAAQELAKENQVLQQALYGSPDVQRMLATAVEQNTRLGQSRELRDMRSLDTAEFAAKYGLKNALARDGFASEYQKLTEFKNQERSTGQMLNDTALTTGATLTDLVGGIATLGAMGVDGVVQGSAALVGAENVPALSPYVAQATKAVSDGIRGQQSDLLQARRVQHALEAQLMKADRDAQEQEEINRGDGTFLPWLRKQGRAVVDTVANYGDDPILLGDKLPEAISSVVGSAGLIKGAAKLAGTSAVSAVAPVTAALESGSAISQTQNQIMNMTEGELSESPDYVALREAGLSHEAAQNRLALNAGAIAGALTAPGALLAGKISAPFAAAPLASGGKGGVIGALRNVGSEVVEEALQEGNSQLMQNVAMNAGAGLNVALDEGVAEAAAEGAIGGIMGAGPLQAAGLAGSSVAAGAKAVKERATKELEVASPTGSAARLKSVEELKQIADTFLRGEIDENGNSIDNTTPKPVVRDAVSKAVFLDEETAVNHPDLPRTEDGKVTRQSLMEKSLQSLQTEGTSSEDKFQAAVDILEGFEEMRKLEADAIEETDLSEARKEELGKIRSIAAQWESSGMREVASKAMQELKQEDLPEVIRSPEILKTMDPAIKKEIVKTFDVVSQVNPELIPQSSYEAVLNQIDGLVPIEVVTSLQASQAVAEMIEATDAGKASIDEDTQSKANQTTAYKTWDAVRKEITVDGNSDNKMLSLNQHREKISSLARAGRAKEAYDALDDLVSFAKSQINKMNAFNEAAANGVSSPKAGVKYEAFGPYRKFFMQEQGAWVNPKSANSIALVREVHIDTMAAVDLANAMARIVKPEMEALQSPELAEVVLETMPKESKGRQIHERRLRKDAFLKKSESLIDYGDKKPKAHKLEEPKKRPFTQTFLANIPKGIDPEGKVGKELRAAGLNSKNAVGLFRRNGLKDLDNLPASEFGEYAYLLAQDENGYLSEQAIVDALVQEASGSPVQDSRELAKAQAKKEADQEEQTEAKQTQTKQTAETKAQPEPVADVVVEEEVQPEPEKATETSPEEEILKEDEEETFNDTKSWFDSLKSKLLHTKDGVNHFLRAFKPAKNGSTLSGKAFPAGFILENLDKLATEDNALNRELTDKEKARVKELLEEDLQAFSAALNRLLGKALSEKNAGDLLKSGKDPLAYPNLRAMNFLVQGEKGVRFERAVVEALFMATMEWKMDVAAKGRPKLKDREILEMFGMGPDGIVTADMRTAAQSGVPLQTALMDISRKFQTLLGVSENKSVSASHTQGIMKHMAANALHLLDKAGQIQREDYKRIEKNAVSGDTNVRQLTMLKMTDTAKADLMLQDLKGLPDIFTQIFTKGHTKARHIGSKPLAKPQTQMGNSLARLSSLEKQVIQRMQDTPNYVNIPMVDVLMALGEDTYKRLMGYKDIDPKKMNQVVFASQDGKNKSLDRAWNESFGYIDETLAVSESQGTLFSETPIYFEWNVSSVGRLQQQGRITPQGDKTFRELVSSTWSTLDMTEQENQDVFWLAVAQSMGMGIEKSQKARNIVKIQNMMGTDLQEAVSLLEIFFETGELDQAAFVEAVSAVDEMTPKALHALATVARYNVAKREGQEKAFRTSLAIEADGKTDGPVNAMVHMTGGWFNEDQIKRLAKGGLFFTNKEMALSAYMQAEEASTGEPHKDLYTTAAGIFQSRLKETVNGNAEAFPTITFLASYLDGFDVVADGNGKIDELEISRKITKNPLTVFLYGSGENGIAGKILDAAMENFYAKLSQVAAGEQNVFSNDEIAVLQGFFGSKALARMFADPVKAELKEDEVTAARENVNKFFGQPMLDAIDETTGGLAKNMKLQQLASQIQAYAFQARLAKALEARQTELVKSGEIKAGEQLSTEEMEAVFADVSRLAPIYKTNAQQFHIAAQTWKTKKFTSEKNGKESGRKVSESLAGDYSSELRAIEASDPSVKVSPYMTIGAGDGRMILEIFNGNEESVANALGVFDGVEQAIQFAGAASEHINNAVFKAWMETNVYRSLADGYFQLMSEFDGDILQTLPAQTLNAIRERVGKKKDLPVTASDLEVIFYQVEKLAEQVDARKYAMSQLPTMTDHMAGMEKPAANGDQSIDLDPLNTAEIVQKLNGLVQEFKTKAEKKQKDLDDAPVVQAPSPELTEAVAKAGEPVEGFPKVFKLSGSQVLGLLRKNSDLSKEQKDVLFQVLNKNDAELSQATYFFGSREDLIKVRNRDYAGSLMANTDLQLGQYSTVAGGAAFIANISPETVMHEMLHSHTVRILNAHYTAPNQSTEQVKVAVAQLEKLKDMMLNLTITDPALDTLRKAVAEAQTPANQMGEFISWSLSNQKLIELGKRKKSYAILADILQKTLGALKRLLGIKNGPSDTVFSQIRFNTQILISEPAEVVAAEMQAEVETVLAQTYPVGGYVSRIEQQFLNRLTAFWDATRPDASARQVEQDRFRDSVIKLQQQSQKALDEAMNHGFVMNAREQVAFRTIYSALTSGMQLDPTLLRQANKLYGHVLEKLRAADYLDALGIDAQANPNLAQAARDKLDYLVQADKEMLARFISLGLTNEEFNKVLQNLQAPKEVSIDRSSVDGMLRSLANSFVNLLTRLSLANIQKPGDVSRELDRLGLALSNLKKERILLASQNAASRLDQVEDWGSKKLQKGTEKALAKLEALRNQTSNTYLKGAIGMTELVASFGSESASKGAGESLTKLLNASTGFTIARELLSEIRGMTESNASLLRLLNPVRAQVDAVRQDFREGVPEVLAQAFKRKLAREEWAGMHKTLAQTDLAVLGRRRALDLLKNQSNLTKMIQDAEQKVKDLGNKYGKEYLAQSNALAQFMITGEVISNHLQRNAHAIASRAGVGKAAVSQDLVQAIDELVSLYAFEKTDADVRKAMGELVKDETDGMTKVVGFLYEVRGMEAARAGSNRRALLNGWKGYVPTIAAEGESIIVADDSEFKELSLMGYERVGNYYGDPNERYRGKRGYYRSTVGGKNAFRQGIAQTVHETFQGVDSRTGQSRVGHTAGLIIGKKAESIRNNLGPVQSNLKAGEHLLPIVDEDGITVGYERPMASEKLSLVRKDTHLGRMLGVWAGRIAEEEVAQRFNADLVKTLKKIYDDQGSSRANEFVNVADKSIKDPVIRDAWNTLGWRVKQDAEEIFGEKNFLPIRRDMLNDAIGYRAASITDPWTGISRWSPHSQEAVKRVAIQMLGVKAYKRLKTVENVVGDLVSYAKTTIVVRSFVVGFDNIISNMLHLGLHGIDPITGAKMMREKFVEVTQYVKNLEDIGRLKVDLASSFVIRDQERIQARIKALEEANQKLSIMPLIRAGEFSTISENLTEADVAIREGRFSDMIEGAVDKLPGWTATAVKNVLVTKDTALFQGLNRMVQYGDFVAKAVLYEHLKKKGKKTEQQILDTLFEEFVPYNRLPGRTRDALESMGLLWFFNYKLRIMKIAAKTLRKRPFSALVGMGVVGPTAGVDTVWSGSLTGALLDGGLAYNVGPEMGMHAGSLNPWFQIFNR